MSPVSSRNRSPEMLFRCHSTFAPTSSTLLFMQGSRGDISLEVLDRFCLYEGPCSVTDEAGKFHCVMQGVARATGKSIRDSGYVASGEFDDDDMVTGTTLLAATFVKVHGQWVPLPVLVWMLDAVACLATTLTSRRLGLQQWETMFRLFFTCIGMKELGKRWKEW